MSNAIFCFVLTFLLKQRWQIKYRRLYKYFHQHFITLTTINNFYILASFWQMFCFYIKISLLPSLYITFYLFAISAFDLFKHLRIELFFIVLYGVFSGA